MTLGFESGGLGPVFGPFALVGMGPGISMLFWLFLLGGSMFLWRFNVF